MGRDLSGYEAQLALCETAISTALTAVAALAIGGTAVGTGLNTHAEFGARVAATLAGKLALAASGQTICGNGRALSAGSVLRQPSDFGYRFASAQHVTAGEARVSSPIAPIQTISR